MAACRTERPSPRLTPLRLKHCDRPSLQRREMLKRLVDRPENRQALVVNDSQQEINRGAGYKGPLASARRALVCEPQYAPEPRGAQELHVAQVEQDRVIEMEKAHQIVAEMVSIASVDLSADSDHGRGGTWIAR